MTHRKRIDITDGMLEQIQRITGTTVAASDIVVYEAAALSTRALHKPGSIFHGARPTRELLLDMAAGLRSGEHSVPLHTMHQQGHELPIGRVFDAQVIDEGGEATLMSQFYLPNTEADLIQKIDLAVLDEVSVGVKSKQGLCSKCGFDFFGSEAGYEFLWDQTCENGHTIGQDGAHLKMVGLDNWMELSLVSRGASKNPKIRSRVREVMPQATYDRLAASAGGKSVEALMLFAQNPMENPMKNSAVPGAAPAFDAQAAFDGLSAKIDAFAAQLTSVIPAPAAELSAEEKLAAAEARIAELEAAATAAAEAEAEAAAAAEAEAAAAAAAAAEPPAAEPPAVVPPANIPVGGVSASAVSDAKPDLSHLAASAFKTKPKHR